MSDSPPRASGSFDAPEAVPAGTAAPPPARAESSTAEELARLADLHEAGAISDDEFQRAKALALS